MKNFYIVASCKDWHKENFHRALGSIDDNFVWVKDSEELKAAISGDKPQYIFFLHWNWHVPEEIWSCYECVCFHMTDVPYGRGGSPLQNLILQGHTSTKLTALKMVEEMDAGPVYKKLEMSLHGTAQEIYVRAGELSFEIIKWMIEAKPVPSEQQGSPYYFKRRKPEQSVLPDNLNSAQLYDFIRMLDADGYPHAYIQHNDVRIEFTSAALDDGVVRASVEFKLPKVGG